LDGKLAFDWMEFQHSSVQNRCPEDLHRKYSANLNCEAMTDEGQRKRKTDGRHTEHGKRQKKNDKKVQILVV